jgi:hypothetical protein
LSGVLYGGGGAKLRELSSYPIDRVATARDPRSEYGILLPGDVGALFKDLLTKSSPSRAHVSLPTFLGELKDFGPSTLKVAPPIFRRLASAQFLESFRAIPELIRQFGNTLIGWAANGYISWRWIIKPMISDVNKMLQFQDEVEKRRRELGSLIDGKKSRRRVQLETSTVVRPQTRVFYHTSTGLTAQADWSITYTKKTWGVAKWKLTDPNAVIPGRTSERERNLAKKLTLGITSFELLQAAWELTPWSWFADWFAGIGDLVALHNNSVPSYWSDACIMRTLTSKAEYVIVPGHLQGWAVEVQPIVEEMVLKQRFDDLAAWLPVLPTSLPLLDSRRWSILSALAASSIDRGLPAFHRRWGR